MNTALARQCVGFTWDDYRTWPDDERWQIVDGIAYAMNAPLTRHQLLQARLTYLLYAHLDGKPCTVLPAPTDLKLSEEDVVQPDLLVVCEPEKIKTTHVEGAPRLIVEILSPSTEQLDRGPKLDLYAASGVPEVWLITPYPPLLEIFRLDGDTYRRVSAFTERGTFHSPVFPDLTLDLPALFDLPIAPEERLAVRERQPPYPAGRTV